MAAMRFAENAGEIWQWGTGACAANVHRAADGRVSFNALRGTSKELKMGIGTYGQINFGRC